MTFRSRKLLDVAHEAPCQATFHHICVGYRGCEPAHSDWSMFGRGHGHKSNDWAFAFLCHNAHEQLSVIGKDDRELKQMEWLRAYVGTQNWLWNNERLRLV